MMQTQFGALSSLQEHSVPLRECCIEEYASLAKVWPQLIDILCKSNGRTLRASKDLPSCRSADSLGS